MNFFYSESKPSSWFQWTETPKPSFLSECTGFLWNHKFWLLGGAATLWCALKILNRNKPILVDAKITSTLDRGVLVLNTPALEIPPLKSSMTICVDESASMGENVYGSIPIKEVKETLCKILDDAQQVVDLSIQAIFEIAVVGFTTTSQVVIKPTKLTPSTLGNKTSALELKQILNSQLNASGGTEIVQGLQTALIQFREMANRMKEGKHTFVLLTDGEQQLNQRKELEALSAFKTELASKNAKLFVVGIGRNNQVTMQKIVSPISNGFSGTYVDTSQGDVTIRETMSKAYAATAPLFNLAITSPLKHGRWSVDSMKGNEVKGQSIIPLGNFAQNSSFLKVIRIHSELLDEALELGKLKFTLLVEDPYGRKGTINLSWNAHTTIIPEILKGRLPEPTNSLKALKGS